MSPLSFVRRFWGDGTGAVLPVLLIIFPALMLIGGLATDATQLNAQRRYTQSQADLAAQSAARHLPDPVAVRAAARRVVRANPEFGDIQLADTDIQLGSYTPENGFRPAADQNSPTGVSAVQVVVPSPFRPILLGPVLSDEDVVVRRRAIAAQGGDSAALFMLRNRLVGLDLEQSALHSLLGPLGLGLTLNILSYEGLANTRLKLDDLLGLATAGVAIEALTFDDVLQLPVKVPQLLGGLVKLGTLPRWSVPGYLPSSDTITFSEIMEMSPGLAHLRAGDILPNVSVSALDFLVVLAQLQSSRKDRLGVDLGLDLNKALPGVALINRLAMVDVDLGLIRPPVWVLARTSDQPPKVAKVEQTGATINASTLSLIELTLQTGVASAEAKLHSLNCSAAGPNDVAAVFEVKTAPINLDIRLSLLKITQDVPTRDMTPIPLSGKTQLVSITRAQMGKPVRVENPIQVSGIVGGLSSLLDVLREDIVSEQKRCSGVLGGLLCPVSSLLTGVTGGLLALLSSALTTVNDLLIKPLMLDGLVNQLVKLLGLAVAEAELVLSDTSCGSGGLVQ